MVLFLSRHRCGVKTDISRAGIKSLFCKSQVSLESLLQVSSQDEQVLNFKLQVLNKSLVLVAQMSVSVLITKVNLKSLIA